MRPTPPTARFPSALLAAALAAASLHAPAATALPPPQDPSASEWNQWAGDAGRTGAVDVEPVRGEPRELWSLDLPGELLSEPVTWAGIAYVVAARGTSRVLLAVRVEDGSVQATQYLRGRAKEFHLAAWKGTVVAGSSEGMEGVHHRGSYFQRGWRNDEPCSIPLLVHDGAVHTGLLALDSTTGANRGSTCRTGPGSALALAVRGGKPVCAALAFTKREGYEGVFARLDTVPGGMPGKFVAMVRRMAGFHDRNQLFRIDGTGPGRGGWIGVSTIGFRGVDADYPALFEPDNPLAKGGLFDLRTRPTVWNDMALGFDAGGNLLGLGVDGTYATVVERKNLPHGARAGPGSRARTVAHFGNWAVDLPTSRVLWCLPDLKPDTPLIPCGDRRLLYGTESARLVCLTDAPAGGPQERGPAAAAAASPAGAEEPPVPGIPPPPAAVGTGLLLVDGRAVEGEFDLYAGTSVRVTPEGGEEILVPDREVAAAFRDGKAVFVRSERPVLEAWRRHLRARVLAELEEVFGLYTKEYLLRRAQAVLTEARGWGLDAVREEEMARALTGRKENPHADNRLKAVEPEVEERRARASGEILAASDWCRERGFPIAGAAVLDLAVRLGGEDDRIRERARACLPEDFPWKDSPGADRLWIRWAAVLAESGASFVPPGDRARRRAAGPWAKAREVVVLRTPHLLLHSRVLDPEVVGRCLRNGETTVEVLTELLGKDAVRPFRSDGDRLDVRLHRNREEYLAEESGAGGFPMPWSAGYFSPVEGISRFYLPGKEEGDPLGRGLFSVLAHELTHHFLEQRWIPANFAARQGTDHRGNWCVEGLARFVEDQVVEMDRRGRRWDDRTVISLDTAAQAAAKGVLFPPRVFVDLRRGHFDRLGDEPVLSVVLRNTLGSRDISGLTLFYEQAGALAFFMVHERGPEGRMAFFEYAARFYGGKDPGEGWKALGFRTAAELDASFRKFLESVR